MGLREAPQLRVAGVPVMQLQALASGEILVLDRMYTHIRDRRMVDVYWLDQLVTAAAAAGSAVVPAGRRMVVADARVDHHGQAPGHRLRHHRSVRAAWPTSYWSPVRNA